MSRFALVLSCVLVVAPPVVPADERPSPFRAPDTIEIIAEAPTLRSLAAKLRPTLVWNETDMLWVTPVNGEPKRFTLNRAINFGNHKNPRWVMVRARPEAEYCPELDGALSYREADVVREAPEPDREEPSHATKMNIPEREGTLYRVRWRGELWSGTGVMRDFQDVFILRTPARQWRFIGDGALMERGRGANMGGWVSDDVAYRIESNAKDSSRITITATLTRATGWHQEPGNPRGLSDFVSHREGTLDPTTKKMKWGKREYVIADSGGTFDQMILRVEPWLLGYSYDEHLRSQPAKFAVLKKVIAELNPRSAAKMRLAPGERMLLPEHDELRKVFDRSPATRPATRPRRT